MGSHEAAEGWPAVQFPGHCPPLPCGKGLLKRARGRSQLLRHRPLHEYLQ
jgi:hypothetical protein